MAGHDWLDVLTALAGNLLGLGGIGALVTALIYLFKARGEGRKIHADTDKTEAETISLYQNIADRSADRALKLDIRVSVLEALVAKQAKELQRVRDWAERLVKQVIELGAEPVKIGPE
jgi:dihydroxyacetone kinase